MSQLSGSFGLIRFATCIGLVLCTVPFACGGSGDGGGSPSDSGGAAGEQANGKSGNAGTHTSGGHPTNSTGGAEGGETEQMQSGGNADVTMHQMPSDCTANQLYNGLYCVNCPPCDGKGEAGPYPQTSENGLCICKTRPGYFYSTAAEVGTFPCDEDGDGWVRSSARSSLEARTDKALLTNARCDLRVVDHFDFINEAGEEKSVAVPPIELYETDRDDDQGLLDFDLNRLNIPPYGLDGSGIAASMINPLTKYCHTPFADYNDNGLPDVSEWEGSDKPPSVRADQAAFIRFSYFAELFNGHYEGPGTGEQYGHYVIEERSRLPTAPADNHLPITYGPSEGTYWQRCTLAPDTAAATLKPPVGMDFSSVGNVNFHSQFKCLTLSNTHDPKNPNALLPSELKSTYRLNTCGEQGQPTPGQQNPDRASFKCSIVDPKDAAAGDVLWGAVRYTDYPTADKYVRGCVNECTTPKNDCADIAPGISGCVHDANDFGHKLGCAEICDGKDNDGDGVIDNGTDGLACKTQYPGVCADGKTSCKNGKLSCVSILPGQQPEQCDDLDHDCDGDPLVGSLNPIVQVGQVCSAAEEYHPDEAKYKPLVGQCKFGKTQCIRDQVTKTPRLSCVSNLEGQIPAENPCNNADDDCDGVIDQNRTVYEGDNPSDSPPRSQCNDNLDNNCDGITDAQPRGGSYATKLANHTVELCSNKVDDDCDGTVDNKYTQVNKDITGPFCAWPCSAAEQGKSACSNINVPAPVKRYDPISADNPPVGWFFDPPWFNSFWKVIECVDGYWQISKVCGLDQTQAPRVVGTWGGHYDMLGCSESNGAADCSNNVNTNTGNQHSWPPTSTWAELSDANKNALQCINKNTGLSGDSGNNCPALAGN